MRAQVTYPAGLENVTLSRRFTEHWLSMWGCEALADDAQLLVSELVSNAVLHAGTEVTLMLEFDDGRLRIEVADRDGALPMPRAPLPEATTGRGLLIVDRISDRWGTTARPDGKIVWAELVPASP